MEEKQSKKLAKVLSKLGLDEEKINEVFEVIDKDDEEEVVVEEEPAVEEPKAEEEVAEVGEEVGEVEEAPVEEEQVEEEPVANEPVEPEVNEGEVEQVEEAEPLVEEEKPTEEPAPVIDPIVQLQSRLDEMQKVNDGLVARIGSLEEELSKAGVLRAVEEKPAEEVGVDESSTETSKYASKSFDEILRRLNR